MGDVAPVIEGQLTAKAWLAGVDALRVYEHVWRHMGPPGTGLVAGIVDHSRGEDAQPTGLMITPPPLGWVDTSTALQLAIAATVVRLAGLGWILGRLRGKHASCWIFRSDSCWR